jgi:hypothetical protein
LWKKCLETMASMASNYITIEQFSRSFGVEVGAAVGQ